MKEGTFSSGKVPSRRRPYGSLFIKPSGRDLRPGWIRGFTIVEVMVAATVMVLAIVTSITTMQRSYRSLDTARNTTIAGQILQSEFEKMRVKDWSEVAKYDVTKKEELTIDKAFTSLPGIGDRFTLIRSTIEPRSDLRAITLTISWKSLDGITLSRSQYTYYGKDGLYDYFYNSK